MHQIQSILSLTFGFRAGGPIYLPETLDSELAETLIKHGIGERFPQPVQAWRTKVEKIKNDCNHERNVQFRDKEIEIARQRDIVGRIIRNKLARIFTKRFA